MGEMPRGRTSSTSTPFLQTSAPLLRPTRIKMRPEKSMLPWRRAAPKQVMKLGHKQLTGRLSSPAPLTRRSPATVTSSTSLIMEHRCALSNSILVSCTAVTRRKVDCATATVICMVHDEMLHEMLHDGKVLGHSPFGHCHGTDGTA